VRYGPGSAQLTVAGVDASQSPDRVWKSILDILGKPQ